MISPATKMCEPCVGLLESIRARLREAVDSCSIAEVARRTDTSAETVRRYCNFGVPSVAFIAAVCREWNINANWLLFGELPKHGKDFSAQVVSLLSESADAEIVACQLVRCEGPTSGNGSSVHAGQTSPAVLVRNLRPRTTGDHEGG